MDKKSVGKYYSYGCKNPQYITDEINFYMTTVTTTVHQ